MLATMRETSCHGASRTDAWPREAYDMSLTFDADA
jgi:hypothetical protein